MDTLLSVPVKRPDHVAEGIFHPWIRRPSWPLLRLQEGAYSEGYRNLPIRGCTEPFGELSCGVGMDGQSAKERRRLRLGDEGAASLGSSILEIKVIRSMYFIGSRFVKGEPFTQADVVFKCSFWL